MKRFNKHNKRYFVIFTTNLFGMQLLASADWAQKLFYEQMKATMCVEITVIFRPLLGHPALLQTQIS